MERRLAEILALAIAVPIGTGSGPDDHSLRGYQGGGAWCDHDGGRRHDRSAANHNNTRRHDGRRNDRGDGRRPHRWGIVLDDHCLRLRAADACQAWSRPGLESDSVPSCFPRLLHSSNFDDVFCLGFYSEAWKRFALQQIKLGCERLKGHFWTERAIRVRGHRLRRRAQAIRPVPCASRSTRSSRASAPLDALSRALTAVAGRISRSRSSGV